MLRCAIAGVEAVEARTRHTFARHTHERFGIGVIDHGAQKSYSGRGMVEAGAGDTITVNPGEVHDGAPIGDAGRSWRILYFDPDLVVDAIHDMSEGKTKTFEFSHPVIRDAAIAGRFQQLFHSMTTDSTAGTALLREESLLMLLADVMRRQNDSGTEQSIPDAIFKAQSLIDDDPASPITLYDLARESGLSRFQVLRGFAKATGFTPHAYLIQRRIHLARHLIAQGAPLADAAAASGFADQSHMTRVFVRKYGVSPRVYADAVT
ncbi:MAG TPA: AraC family transcriptional regulator [Noviherbaspirillum sp.]|nr:AraC family transcriptional regulator [Noviherbaspirillum sp.]